MPFAVEISGLLGVLIVLMGTWGVLAPTRVTDFLNRFQSRGGMWFAAAVRLVIGLALWFAAPHSRAPLLLQVLGVVAIVAAVIIPLLGVARFRALVGWWSRLSSSTQRAWSLLAVVFGAVILWALLPTAT